jgi:hypothetical protein
MPLQPLERLAQVQGRRVDRARSAHRQACQQVQQAESSAQRSEAQAERQAQAERERAAELTTLARRGVRGDAMPAYLAALERSRAQTRQARSDAGQARATVAQAQAHQAREKRLLAEAAARLEKLEDTAREHRRAFERQLRLREALELDETVLERHAARCVADAASLANS